MNRRKLLIGLVATVLLAGIVAGIRVGAAASLGLTSDHVWAGTQALTKGTCVVSGSTATWVDEKNPTRAESGDLEVESRKNRDRWAFVSFDLSSCGLPATGGADQATLTLKLSSAPRQSRTLTLTPVLTPWNTSLTWNGAQPLAYGPPTTTFASGTNNGATFALDVTAAVDALIRDPSSSNGWRIDDEGGSSSRSALALAASGSGQPKLTIDWEK